MRRMLQGGMAPGQGIGPFLFLSIILAVMVGSLIYMGGAGSDRDAEVPVREQGDPNRDDITMVRTDFDPKTDTWGVINDENLEGQLDIPVEAFKKAADIVALTSWNKMRWSASVLDRDFQGFKTLDIQAAFAQPSKLRGQPVEVLGTLQTLEDFDLFDAYTHKLPDGRYQVKKGTLRARKGKHNSDALIRFTLLDKIDPKAPVLVPGSQVKLQGVFFKLQRDETESGPETGVWVLGKKLLRSFKLPAGDEIDLRMLDAVHDAVKAEDAARDPLEEPPFYHLLAAAHEGRAISADSVLEMKGKQLVDLHKNPSDYRGKTLEFGARIMRIDHHTMSYWFPEHDIEDNPIDEFWLTYITPDDNYPMTVLWLNEPPADLKKRDQVRMRATFYRLWGYKAQRGAVKAPLLVGIGEMDVVTLEPEIGLSDPLTMGLIIFSLLVLVLLIVVLRFDRRRARLFKDTLAAKRRLQRKSGTLAPKASTIDPDVSDSI